eukprot:SAG31_NODE_3451_length_4255_cov_5.771655_4_plen_84_part_00
MGEYRYMYAYSSMIRYCNQRTKLSIVLRVWIRIQLYNRTAYHIYLYTLTRVPRRIPAPRRDRIVLNLVSYTKVNINVVLDSNY